MPRPIPRNTSTDSTNRIITRRPDIVHTPWRGIFIGLVALIVVIIIAVSVSKHRSTSQHQSMRYTNRSTITSSKPAPTQKNTSWTGKKPSSSKVSKSRAKSSGITSNTKKTSKTDHGYGREKFLILGGRKVTREQLLQFKKSLESQGLSLKDLTTPEEWKKVQDVLGEEKETEKAEKDNITQTKKESQLTTSTPKPTIEYGYIVITSQPSGAEVYIDDTYKGHTACTIKLPIGAHVVSLKMSGYLQWAATVNVSQDKAVELTRKLIQEP